MSLARRHRALRCFFVAHHLGVSLNDVSAWADAALATPLAAILRGGG